MRSSAPFRPTAPLAFETASRDAGVPVTRIGVMKAGEGAPAFIQADGTTLQLPVKGFEHFAP